MTEIEAIAKIKQLDGDTEEFIGIFQYVTNEGKMSIPVAYEYVVFLKWYNTERDAQRGKLRTAFDAWLAGKLRNGHI